MENWGKVFIEQYTEKEKESLQLLVGEVFERNMLIVLESSILEQICRIWWVVLGSFGNTALFDFVLNDQKLTKKICEDTGINYEFFITAAKRLKNDDVINSMQSEEKALDCVVSLIIDIASIYADIANIPYFELIASIANTAPDPELLSRFYVKVSEIMDKGSNTWRNIVMSEWNGLIGGASRGWNV